MRLWHLDVLRVISICAVVVIHVSAQFWDTLNIYGHDWAVANFYDGLMRWSVPVFVMISGALFLDPDRPQSIRKIWRKNILGIVWIIAFWGFTYAAISVNWASFSLESIGSFIKEWLLGHYHMWFLYVIIGLYIITPVIRCITKHQKAMNYFIAIGIVVDIINPFLCNIGFETVLSIFLNQLSIKITLGYVLYFVIGFKLNQADCRGVKACLLYTCAFVGLASTVLFTSYASMHEGVATAAYYDNFSLPVFLASIGVFVFTKNVCGRLLSGEDHPLLLVLSKNSLGVYMVHVMILGQLMRVGLNSMSFDPVFAIPVTALFAITISYIASFLISKIPVLGRYCV